MRAEPRPICVAGSAGLVRGRYHQFASARPEILLASSTGSAADDEAVSALCSCAIELGLCAGAGARSLATSTRDGLNALVQGHIASRMFVTGHRAIAARTTVTSPARHLSIDPDQLQPVDPARHPRRLTDRQLALTD